MRLRVPRAHSADRVALPLRARRRAARRRGDGRRARRTPTCGGGARSRSWNPVTRYRFLLSGGDVGYAWVNALGLTPHEVTDADDFAVTTGRPAPPLARRVGRLRDLPRPLRDVAPRRRGAAVGDPRARGTRCRPAAGKATPSELLRRRPPRRRAAPRPHRELGANLIYLTPVLPGASSTATTRPRFDHVDPLLGGDDALARSATPRTRAASA